MSTFRYTAIERNGKHQKGVIEADNLKQARQLLRERQLMPIEVASFNENKSRWRDRIKFSSHTVSVSELALFTRQLATLLSAGIPLDESLLSVAEQTEKNRIKAIIMGVRTKVLEGFTLAASLSEYPRVFNLLYRATIAAGEKTGKLDSVLERLADYVERRQQVRQKILQALIYPVVVIFVAISIVTFLLTYIVPKMVGVFQQSGQILPTATKILLAVSSTISSVGIYILLSLILIVFLFVRALKRPDFKANVDKKLLILPLIGKTSRLTNTARFAHTFAILTTAGVEVIEAMRIASELVSNTPIRESLEMATRQVREGVPIYRALKETHYMPPMSVYLIASGENSGQLAPMLERVAAYQEQQVEQMINIILTLFEPLMILVMGSIVLFIVLAILLPIFNMDQMVQ